MKMNSQYWDIWTHESTKNNPALEKQITDWTAHIACMPDNQLSKQAVITEALCAGPGIDGWMMLG